MSGPPRFGSLWSTPRPQVVPILGRAVADPLQHSSLRVACCAVAVCGPPREAGGQPSRPPPRSYDLGAGVIHTNTGLDPSNIVGKIVITPNKLLTRGSRAARSARWAASSDCTRSARPVRSWPTSSSQQTTAFFYPVAADYLTNIIAAEDRRDLQRTRLI